MSGALLNQRLVKLTDAPALGDGLFVMRSIDDIAMYIADGLQHDSVVIRHGSALRHLGLVSIRVVVASARQIPPEGESTGQPTKPITSAPWPRNQEEKKEKEEKGVVKTSPPPPPPQQQQQQQQQEEEEEEDNDTTTTNN